MAKIEIAVTKVEKNVLAVFPLNNWALPAPELMSNIDVGVGSAAIILVWWFMIVVGDCQIKEEKKNLQKFLRVEVGMGRNK